MRLPKKLYQYFLRVFIFLVIVSLVFPLQTQAPAFASTGSQFVTTSGSQLMLSGKPYKFTGVNAYELGTLWGTNAGCGTQVDDIDAFFSSLRPNSVVRLWGFQGSIGTNVATKQVDFTGLDRVVKSAELHGQRLIIALAGQSGTCDDGHWKDKNWYLGGYRQAYNDDGRGMAPLPYLEYAKIVVERYKNSPAIAMWEPVSEPEASDCDPGYMSDACYVHESCPDQAASAQALKNFFDTVGGEIKRIDSNHLVESGVIGSGQCGAKDGDYTYIHTSPGIDVGSFHDYGLDSQAMPGDIWSGLKTRIEQLRSINKPIIVGEVGIEASSSVSNCKSLTTRRDLMQAKMMTQLNSGVSGFLPWNHQPKNFNNCTHDISSGDPLLTLIRDFPLDSVTATPTPTVKPTLSLTPSPPAVVSQTVHKKLGGLDLGYFCSSRGLPGPKLATGNWTCGSTGQNINMTEACITQYKYSSAYAKQDRAGNQYSWSCYIGTTATPSPSQVTATPTPTKATMMLGGINLDGYCGSLGKGVAALSGSTWICKSDGTAITMTNACRWQYKENMAYAKQDNAGNPYSWTCYK